MLIEGAIEAEKNRSSKNPKKEAGVTMSEGRGGMKDHYQHLPSS